PGTVSLRRVPAVRAGYWLAGMLICSVVPGLTPVRALRLRTSKVPKPVRVTLLPLAMFSVIVSRSESIVSFTAFLDSPVFSATSLTSSALLTVLVLAIGELLSRTRPEYRAWVTAKRQIGTMAVGKSTRRARAGRRPTFAPVRRRPGGIVCDAMTGEMLTVMLVLLGAVALFVSDRVRLDVVALLVILALTLTGSLTPAQALAGFADPLVVMIAALFVVSGALVQTGVADAFGRALGRLAGGGETRMVVAVMLATGLLSAFMSSTGTVAVMLPIVMAMAWRAGVSPSKLLIPTAYAALVGGMLTLIATPPNLVASQALEGAGRAPFGFFAFTPFGLGMLAVSVAFMATLGRRLRPARAPAAPGAEARGDVPRESLTAVAERFGLPTSLARVVLPPGSPLVGRRLKELRWPERLGVQVLAV